MNIHIETIPHNDQRYETCGDWFFDEDGLQVRVSDMDNREYEFLVAMHECVEAFLCLQKGISEESVTDYDLKFEALRDTAPEVVGDMEPGDMVSAPYYTQHRRATNIEDLLASYLNVDWKKYDKKINELYKHE